MRVVSKWFVIILLRPPRTTRTDTRLPYTTLFRSARGAFAQLLFLLVHIIAGPRARDRADARADDFLGAAVLAADQIAEQIAAERAADAADRRLRYLAFAGHRIGDATGQRDRADAGQNGELDRLAVHFSLPYPADASEIGRAHV